MIDQVMQVAYRKRNSWTSLGDIRRKIAPDHTLKEQDRFSFLTGHKTVLEYLLKPILKARETAMTER